MDGNQRPDQTDFSSSGKSPKAHTVGDTYISLSVLAGPTPSLLRSAQHNFVLY